MRALYVIVPLFALLAAAIWFAASAWTRLGGVQIPLWAWLAVGGGVLFSSLIGGGLIALMFYSSRHGYDDEQHGFGDDQR
jgi:hypothetical protein